MVDATVTVPTASLVLDYDLYPRHAVDSAHVSDLARAIDSGYLLPPPVVDRDSMRVVDGFHRVRARVRACGKDASIDVVLRDYADEADIVREAVAANADHGRKLDSQDRTRSALLLERAGFGAEESAVILRTTVERVEEHRRRVVKVGRRKEPAKPVAWPKRGEQPRRLTREQAEAMRRFSGLRPAQAARQLADALRSGLIDMSDEATAHALADLRDALADRVGLDAEVAS